MAITIKCINENGLVLMNINVSTMIVFKLWGLNYKLQALTVEMNFLIKMFTTLYACKN